MNSLSNESIFIIGKREYHVIDRNPNTSKNNRSYCVVCFKMNKEKRVYKREGGDSTICAPNAEIALQIFIQNFRRKK